MDHRIDLKTLEKLSAKELGQNLKFFRENAKLSVKEIASELKISPKSYYNYESGLREPPLSMIVSLANFYGVKIDELILNQRNPEYENTITYDTYSFDKNGTLIRTYSTRIGGTLNNVFIVKNDKKKLLDFYVKTDLITNGKVHFFYFHDKPSIGKLTILKDKSLLIEVNNETIRLTGKEKSEVYVIGIYLTTIIHDFDVKGFF